MASDDSESMLSAERQKSSTISKQMRSARNLDQSRMNTPHTSRYDRSVIQTNLRTSDTMRESELDLAAGSLLQDRLREVKAARLQDSMKAKGGSRLSENIRETQSSPSVSHQSRKRKSDVASSTATRVVTGDLQRSMGAKAMEEKLTAIGQENFDLKLEIHHRRDKQAELEAKIERLDERVLELENNYDESLMVNEEIHAQLAMRDRAIEEAVIQILTLEERVEELLEERKRITSIRPITNVTADDETAPSDDALHLPSSPPSLAQRRLKPFSTPVQSARSGFRFKDSIYRMPSFLTDQNEETNALRSMFLPRGQSIQSLRNISGSNDGASDRDVVNSPRLSVLSESSFLSVYGNKKSPNDDMESLALSNDFADEIAEQGVSANAVAVDRWVDEGLNSLQESSKKRSTPRRMTGDKSGQYLSMNDIVQSPLQRLEKLQRTIEKRNAPVIAARLAQRDPETTSTAVPVMTKKNTSHSESNLMPAVARNLLPPTPDTFSTSTLTTFNNVSNETVQGHLIERPLQSYDSRERIKSTVWGAFPKQPTRRQPNVSETVTSRRDGHGLDTATQSELTEEVSDYQSERTTADSWAPKPQQDSTPAAMNPPAMFSFSTDDNGWSASGIPGLAEPSYGLGRSQLSSQIRNAHGYSSRSDIPHGLRGTIHPPERRSSLADSPSAEQKRARRQQAALAAENVEFAATPQKSTRTASRNENQPALARELPKTGIARFGFGFRSASATAGAFCSKGQKPVEQAGSSSTQDVGKDLSRHGATPPPISRYPHDHLREHKSRLPTGTHAALNYNKTGSQSSGLASVDSGRAPSSRQHPQKEIRVPDDTSSIQERDGSIRRGQAKDEPVNKGKWYKMSKSDKK